MRPSDSYYAIGESLQADVMRFMAIIAFCLIAILALVRSVEPSVPKEVEVSDPAPEAARVETPEVQPVVQMRSPPAGSRAIAAPPRPAPARAPEPAVPAAEPVAAAPSPEPATLPRPQPAPSPPPRPEPTGESGTKGLSLRFASEQDFLRLVNRGRIQVFAFNDGEVLAVSADFRFQEAHAPGRLHELLPETIPDLMTTALQSAHNGSPYRWGIAMPDRMARQIRQYVDRGATGELVIDRFGEVRHHGA